MGYTWQIMNCVLTASYSVSTSGTFILVCTLLFFLASQLVHVALLCVFARLHVHLKPDLLRAVNLDRLKYWNICVRDTSWVHLLPCSFLVFTACKLFFCFSMLHQLISSIFVMTADTPKSHGHSEAVNQVRFIEWSFNGATEQFTICTICHSLDHSLRWMGICL